MSSTARLVGSAEGFSGALESAPEQAAPDRIALLILGMHRSGTSALARIMNILGCALPHNLIPPTDGNTSGHWESSRVAAFNDALLDAAGTVWDDFMPVNPGFRHSPVWHRMVEKARTLLREEFDDAPLFVLKDPRISRLAPFWLEVLEAERVFPAIVIATRDPQEVALSHEHRDAMDVDYAQLLWLRHVLDAECATRHRARTFIRYPDLIDNWKDASTRIGEKFQLSWPRSSPTAEREIAEFLDPELHRRRRSGLSSTDISSPPWVVDSFAIVKRWSDQGEDSADYATLDRIAHEFSLATPNLVDSMRKVKIFSRRELEHGGEIEVVTRDRDYYSLERDRLLEQLASIEAEYGALGARSDSLAVERDRLTDEVAAAASRQSQRDEELEQTHRALDQTTAEAADLAEKLETASSSLTGRDRTIAELRRALDHSRAAAVSLEVTNAKLERGQGERFDELARITRRLRQTETDLEAQRLRVFELQATQRLIERKASKQEKTLKWFSEVYSITSHLPRWWKFLPGTWRSGRILRLLKASGHFDGERYLYENDDVRRAGTDPLFHYLVHGVAEDRNR